MAITYRTAGAWGGGKGSPLTAAEIDTNFCELLTRITDLETNPAEPISITAIESVGSGFQVLMSDATIRGPFSWPVAAFRWRGEWAPATEYEALDLLYFEDNGLVLVTTDHTSAATFNILDTDTGGYLYRLLFINTTLYDLAMYAPGPLDDIPAGTPIFQMVAARNFFIPATSTDNPIVGYAYLRIPANVTLEIMHNDVLAGYITFSVDNQNGEMEIFENTWLVPGDVLSIGFDLNTET